MKPTLERVAAGVDLGPCWIETCTQPGQCIVRGVLAFPSDPTFAELVATAERITRIGITCCLPHGAGLVGTQAELLQTAAEHVAASAIA